jgi:transposase
MLWRLKNGAPWREIPERYGPWQTCWDRFTTWERKGLWKRILQRLQAHADAVGDIDWDGAALDSSHAKAHRCATGARKQLAEGEKRGS